LDAIDKVILQALRLNCRVQYQTLANGLGLSLNAIKNRVKRLLESGVIVQFGVWLNYTIINAGFSFILLSLDGKQDEGYLTDLIAANPMTLSIGFNSIGGGIIRTEYSSLRDLAVYGSFLRQLQGVTSIDIHPIEIGEGRRYEFSKIELKVLRCLRDDPRIPVRAISSKAGLSSSKVASIIQQFYDEELIQFSIDWNLNAGGSTAFILRIDYDEKLYSFDKLEQLIRSKFDLEYWGSLKSALQPLTLAFFTVDHIREAEDISKELRKQDCIRELQVIVPYPERKMQGLCGTKLDEMLKGIVC
jgi:DNA-binding Lrp family transcriptional regulator